MAKDRRIPSKDQEEQDFLNSYGSDYYTIDDQRQGKPNQQKPCTNCGHTGGGGFKWNGISNEPCPSCNHQGRI